MDNREIILNSLKELGIKPVPVSENKYTFGYVTESGDYILSYFLHNPKTDLLLFQGIIPIDIADNKKLEILYFINLVNKEKPFSRFLFNDEIKRVVVESSLILPKEDVPEKLVINTFKSCFTMLNAYRISVDLINNEGVRFFSAYSECDKFFL